MSNNKLLEIYLNNCNAIYRRTGDGLHAIETPEDTFYYSSYEEMIKDIQYTILQWQLENLM